MAAAAPCVREQGLARTSIFFFSLVGQSCCMALRVVRATPRWAVVDKPAGMPTLAKVRPPRERRSHRDSLFCVKLSRRIERIMLCY